MLYTLDSDHEGFGAYSTLVKEFTGMFFGQKHCNGEIDVAFSQKVEQRRLGIVAGFHGSLTWIGDEGQSKETFSFLILHTEVSEQSKTETEPFPTKRYLKIFMKPKCNGQKGAHAILDELNTRFSSLVTCQKGVFLMAKTNKDPVLGSAVEIEGTEGNTEFEIFTIERHSTLPILDGAMKITCGDAAMSVKARICTHLDFGAVHASITENKGVRLLREG